MLPHIKNSKSGTNRYEPVFQNLFEVRFSVPGALTGVSGDDIAILKEQVKTVSGLGTLDQLPEVKEQTFMGTTRSYLGSKLGSTSHDITLTLNLNLRSDTDNFVYKIFRDWKNLIYNPATGEQSVKEDYYADFLEIIIYNKAGDIHRKVLYHDVMLTTLEGAGADLSYESDDIAELSITLRSDWADDNVA